MATNEIINNILDRHAWHVGEEHKYFLGNDIVYDYWEGDYEILPKDDEPSIIGIGVSIWDEDHETNLYVIITDDGSLYYYSGTIRQKEHIRDIIVNKKSSSYTKICVHEYADEIGWSLKDIIDFVALRCQLFE